MKNQVPSHLTGSVPRISEDRTNPGLWCKGPHSDNVAGSQSHFFVDQMTSTGFFFLFRFDIRAFDAGVRLCLCDFGFPLGQ